MNSTGGERVIISAGGLITKVKSYSEHASVIIQCLYVLNERLGK